MRSCPPAMTATGGTSSVMRRLGDTQRGAAFYAVALALAPGGRPRPGPERRRDPALDRLHAPCCRLEAYGVSLHGVSFPTLAAPMNGGPAGGFPRARDLGLSVSKLQTCTS